MTSATRMTPCQVDPDMWFTSDRRGGRSRIERDNERQAIQACRTCPAQTACLQAALDYERGLGETSRWGVWGGTTPAERAQMDRSA